MTVRRKKTRCPYCKKVHKCHNKCASKRVSARIRREGRPRAARRVGYAIARGCSPRRGRKKARRASKKSRRSTGTPVWAYEWDKPGQNSWFNTRTHARKTAPPPRRGTTQYARQKAYWRDLGT